MKLRIQLLCCLLLRTAEVDARVEVGKIGYAIFSSAVPPAIIAQTNRVTASQLDPEAIPTQQCLS